MAQDTVHLVLLTSLLIITVGLFIERIKPAALFGGAVLLLIITGVMPVSTLLEALSNKGILTIFLLILITSSLRQHFNLIGIIDRLFRNIASPKKFTLTMSASVASISAFVNNTPMVALMLPYVNDWSRKRGFAPSKFLIPLAYASSLGGTITLIGTSTNLVLNGMIEANGYEPLAFFDFLVPGLLVSFFGVLYLGTIGYKLIPERRDILEDFKKNTREYIVETQVGNDSNMVGKTVKEAGLRNLEGIYLAELYRDKQLVSPVSPDEIIRKDDLLYFAGEVEQVMELLNKQKGLTLAKRMNSSMESMDVVEVMIPQNSQLAGKTVKENNFRRQFDAAIVAVHRNGHRLGGRIGDLTLEYGDMLLLTTGEGFHQNISDNKDLYTISVIKNSYGSKQKEKVGFGIVALLGIVAMGFGWIDLFTFLLLLTGTLSVLGLLSAKDFQNNIQPSLLILLVSAVAFGAVMIDSGTADHIARFLIGAVEGSHPVTALLATMVATIIITSFVSNIAAAAIALPLVIAIVSRLNMPTEPFFLAIAYGASAAFLTPVGYQTNLMVFGPGGYKNADFFRVGFPLTIIYTVLVMGYLIIHYDLI